MPSCTRRRRGQRCPPPSRGLWSPSRSTTTSSPTAPAGACWRSVGPTVVTDPEMTARVTAADLEPFVDGARNTIVRIEPTFLGSASRARATDLAVTRPPRAVRLGARPTRAPRRSRGRARSPTEDSWRLPEAPSTDDDHVGVLALCHTHDDVSRWSILEDHVRRRAIGGDPGAGVVDDRRDVLTRPVPTVFEEAHRVDDGHGPLECRRRAEGPFERGDRFGRRVDSDDDTNLTGHRVDANAGLPARTFTSAGPRKP